MNSEACEEKLVLLRAELKYHVSNIRRDALIIHERLKIRKLNPTLPGNSDDVIADLAQLIMTSCDELEDLRGSIDSASLSV